MGVGYRSERRKNIFYFFYFFFHSLILINAFNADNKTEFQHPLLLDTVFRAIRSLTFASRC